MAILAGVPAAQAVDWVRSTYCPRAVQEPAQQYWIERWAERARASDDTADSAQAADVSD
jgi:hypothetical protein